jgi:hypothetical protein
MGIQSAARDEPVRSALVAEDADTALLGALNNLVVDLVDWLGHYSDDEVGPAALATITGAVDWVVQRLPSEHRRRLEEMAHTDPRQSTLVAKEGDPELLRVIIGLLVDVLWWLDSCDDEVDLNIAVKQLENAGAVLCDLPDHLGRRLVDIVGELAATEQHPGRRDQFRFFPYATGLVEEEPDDDLPPR